MKADQANLQYLDAPTRAPAWPVGVDGRPLQQNQVAQILEAAIEAATNAVVDFRDILNEWDSKADVQRSRCNSRGHEKVSLFKSYPLNDVAETVNEIGSSIERVGTSGIMSIILLFH